MTEIFSYTEGTAPLLVSIPHDGRELAPGQADRMTPDGLALPDTDWHVRQLYDFAPDLGAHIVSANYSRYVVDLNRSPADEPLYTGQVSTGLCPTRSFAGDELYNTGETVDANEIASRVRDFWQPYHDRITELLAQLKSTFGYALLWDAHSIVSEVPLLCPGRLPQLNLGTDDGRSCESAIAASVMRVADESDYSSVLNGRFRGGFITRHYGRPDVGVHAVQLELAQATYMDENTLEYDAERAERLGGTLRAMLSTFLEKAGPQAELTKAQRGGAD